MRNSWNSGKERGWSFQFSGIPVGELNRLEEFDSVWRAAEELDARSLRLELEQMKEFRKFHEGRLQQELARIEADLSKEQSGVSD